MTNVRGLPTDFGSHWPRNGDGEIMVGGIPLSTHVTRLGRTPCYLYDRGRMTARVNMLRNVLDERVHIHYAMKANPMPAVVYHMSTLVNGLDVASGGELQVAMDTGMNPLEMSFAGPGKTDAELAQAVAAGVLINIESFREVGILGAISQKTGLPARVAVRVNTPFDLKSSGMKMGGGPKPFGVDSEQVPELLRRIDEAGPRFEGFHLFTGSQNLKAESIIDSQIKCYELACELSKHTKQPVKSINVGGGFGIPYFKGDKSLDVAAVIENLNKLAARMAQELPQAHLIIELGRYLVGEAGLYVGSVIDRKVSRDQVFLVIDGGLHHHLAASGNFGQVIRKNYPVAINARLGDEERVTVVGPLCTPLDLMGDRVSLPMAGPGDLFVIFQSGAYGRSASPREFLGHPDVVEALI